jgi:hypothetical protein
MLSLRKAGRQETKRSAAVGAALVDMAMHARLQLNLSFFPGAQVGIWGLFGKKEWRCERSAKTWFVFVFLFAQVGF